MLSRASYTGANLKELNQAFLIRSLEIFDLLSILVEVECGHGPDSKLLRQVAQLVDVDFDKLDVLELVELG